MLALRGRDRTTWKNFSLVLEIDCPNCSNVASLEAADCIESAIFSDSCSQYFRCKTVVEEVYLVCFRQKSEVESRIHIGSLMSVEEYDQARKVAEQAIKIAPSHSQSWYWKGAALLKLSRREDAKFSFQKAAMFESDLVKKTNYIDWVNRCEEEPMEVIDGTAKTVDSKDCSSPKPSPETTPRDAFQGEISKPITTRREWYQSATYVNIDIYAKNVEKDRSTVVFEENRIHVTLARPNMDDYFFRAELFAPIVTSESSWSASRFKVELKLRKYRQGEVWKALDREAQVLSAQAQAGQESIRRRDQQEARQRGLTSFAESELQNYKEDDSAMSLFRTIYKDADDDMRRAMMKSYSESGGKVLSTNWDEVRKEKVTYKDEE
ncbi:unnamed protein product [Agarophyton chilense]